jgi:hypothetical protein
VCRRLPKIRAILDRKTIEPSIVRVTSNDVQKIQRCIFSASPSAITTKTCIIKIRHDERDSKLCQMRNVSKSLLPQFGSGCPNRQANPFKQSFLHVVQQASQAITLQDMIILQVIRLFNFPSLLLRMMHCLWKWQPKGCERGTLWWMMWSKTRN